MFPDFFTEKRTGTSRLLYRNNLKFFIRNHYLPLSSELVSELLCGGVGAHPFVRFGTCLRGTASSSSSSLRSIEDQRHHGAETHDCLVVVVVAAVAAILRVAV